jgi:hypothetical protein
MSLFGDDRYQWRETYFVLFQLTQRPLAQEVVATLCQRNERHTVTDVQADEEGRFESLTLQSPEDFSAMDITLVTGEEVAEHIDELSKEIAKSTLTDDGRKKLARLHSCDARFDIYHFEQMANQTGDEDDFLDPGSLLIVLKRLQKLCHGISIDPQSGMLM